MTASNSNRSAGRGAVVRYYYYKNQRTTSNLFSDEPQQFFLFENSLDVYYPKNYNPNSDGSHKPTCVVILVVGSGWMGHVPWVYAGTSWWNAAGPQTIAATGAVCICVRHRGGFFQWDPMVWWSLSLGVCAVIWAGILIGMSTACSCQGNNPDGTWGGLLECFDACWRAALPVSSKMSQVLAFNQFSVALFLVLILQVIGCGLVTRYMTNLAASAAQLLEMQADVIAALRWIYQHSNTTLKLPPRGKNGIPWYWGGYSSGGHVMATVLADRLPWPVVSQFVDGIVYLSAVLAVRPIPIQTARPQETPDTSLESLALQQKQPRWLTDFVVSTVFGTNASLLPSPMERLLFHQKEEDSTTNFSAMPPHLIVGCQHEVFFGLPWLNVFLHHHSTYAQLLREKEQVAVVHRTVYNSNHWFVLSSSELYTILHSELPTLSQQK